MKGDHQSISGGRGASAPRIALAFFSFLLMLSPAGALAAPPPQGLTNVTSLARIYGEILDARFDQADEEIRQGCSGGPQVPCVTLAAVSTWWRIQLDPASYALDSRMRDQMERAVNAAEAWTHAEPQRGEVWFYLGAACAVRVSFHAQRYEHLAAARDGKRIKDALERALALDPTINDAYFGIGLYHYVADIAPTALKILRFLLLLPGGDRVKGMSEMVQARDRGQLLRGEAEYQMHLLYLWYENKPDRALALLRELHDRYPHNPLFLTRIGDVEDAYLHDHAASLAAYETLQREAHARRISMPDFADVWSHVGAGLELDALYESDRAIEQLKPIVDARPAAPAGAFSRAALALGTAYDHLGDRARAIEAYRVAVANAPADDEENVKANANERLRRTPDPRKAEAYRLSLEAWRLIERSSYAQADGLLKRSLTLDPADPVAHYRLGRLLAATASDDARALSQMDLAIKTRPAAPSAIVAAACLEAGRLFERRGDRTRALDMYQSANTMPGADARIRDEAAQAIARLRGPAGRAAAEAPAPR